MYKFNINDGNFLQIRSADEVGSRKGLSLVPEGWAQAFGELVPHDYLKRYLRFTSVMKLHLR